MDDIDLAVRLGDKLLERGIAAARQPIAQGIPGDCEGCDRPSPRLVPTGGLMLCAPCRDKREKRR